MHDENFKAYRQKTNKKSKYIFLKPTKLVIALKNPNLKFPEKVESLLNNNIRKILKKTELAKEVVFMKVYKDFFLVLEKASYSLV